MTVYKYYADSSEGEALFVTELQAWKTEFYVQHMDSNKIEKIAWKD